ncbi:hypothetical protein FRC15_007217, partial [Serendipita sp. 397]
SRVDGCMIQLWGARVLLSSPSDPPSGMVESDDGGCDRADLSMIQGSSSHSSIDF